MFQTGTFWVVLAISVAVFWGLPRGLRIGFLTLASMAYLAWQTPLNAAALLAWSLLFYYLAPLAARKRAAATAPLASARVPALAGAGNGPGIATPTLEYASRSPAPPREKRWILWLLISGILVYLGCFKYFLPHLKALRTANEYLLPLGVSYFTFKFIHYAIEVARGNIRDRSLWRFLCYIYLFPIFTAGPIERFDHFLASREEQWKKDQVVEGLTRILHGMIKAFVFAGIVLDYPSEILGASGGLLRQIHTQPGYMFWWVAIASYLHLYFNFAGYTDIAIGASRLFGLGIMENFDWPILAPNIGVFWKRWHMSLTGWCMTYVYMPVLGTFRKPNLATYIVFIAIALWHAASLPWLMWGLYHATGLVIFQFWSRFRRKRKWTFADKGPWSVPWKGVAIALTFLFVSAGEMLTLGGVNNFTDMGRVGKKLIFLPVLDPAHAPRSHARR